MMQTYLYPAALLLLLVAFISDRQVAGKCGNRGIADTDWAACLVAEDGDVCPHNLKKFDDDSTCAPSSNRTYPAAWKKRVCCFIGPEFAISVKDSPCLAGTPASDAVDKKSKKHH